jgi:hypothetical protein
MPGQDAGGLPQSNRTRSPHTRGKITAGPMPMPAQQPARPATTIALGLGAAVCGLYLTLAGRNVLPAPGAQHAPGWIVAAAGLAFLCGGIGVMVQGLGRADAHGTLPPGTPRWIVVLQHLVALAVVFCLAAVGTWVALAGEADQFTMSSPLSGETRAAPTIARVAFGIGAAITWLFFVALVKRTVRLLRS